MKKIIIPILVILMVLIPTTVFAQDSGGLIPECVGEDGSVGPTNCSFDDLIQLVANVFEWFIGFAIIISSLAFAYAGFLYITSQGDPGKISQATKIFTNFAIGLVLLLGSFLIIELVLNSFGLDSIFREDIISSQ